MIEENKHRLTPQVTRIALYDNLRTEPQIIDIKPTGIKKYIGSIAAKTYELASGQGGQIPYTVILQVTENFIHANFSEPCISIMDKGNTIRFADQGPGIEDKEKAQLPGFTSATQEMRQYINGVGSGLPIVKEYLKFSNGQLIIEDNISAGTVITISVNPHIQDNQTLVYTQNYMQNPQAQDQFQNTAQAQAQAQNISQQNQLQNNIQYQVQNTAQDNSNQENNNQSNTQQNNLEQYFNNASQQTNQQFAKNEPYMVQNQQNHYQQQMQTQSQQPKTQMQQLQKQTQIQPQQGQQQIQPQQLQAQEQGQSQQAAINFQQQNFAQHQQIQAQTWAQIQGQTQVEPQSQVQIQAQTQVPFNETKKYTEEITLHQRDIDVLALSAQMDNIGPSDIFEKLEIPLSTAHRILKKLEDVGYLETQKSGQHKRFITKAGRSVIS